MNNDELNAYMKGHKMGQIELLNRLIMRIRYDEDKLINDLLSELEELKKEVKE